MAQIREREHKIRPGYNLKIDAEAGIVEAIVSTFGVLDYHDDIIRDGAYKKTISERGRSVKVLDAHNLWSVLSALGVNMGMAEVGRDMLPAAVRSEYPEATGGLWTKTQYLLETPEGLGAFIRLKAGAVDEYSIGYDCMQAEYRQMPNMDGKTTNVRIMTEIRLWEYSPVIFGANPATGTTDVKSGRVIPTKTQIRAALATLNALLENDTDADEPEEKTQAQAGPEGSHPSPTTKAQPDVETAVNGEATREQLLVKRRELLARIEKEEEGL